MTLTLTLLTLCNLALWWRQHRRAQANHAEVWQAVARVKMQHDAMVSACTMQFREIDEKLISAVIDQVVTVASPPDCNCVNCRKRRQLETN